MSGEAPENNDMWAARNAQRLRRLSNLQANPDLFTGSEAEYLIPTLSESPFLPQPSSIAEGEYDEIDEEYSDS